MEIYNQDEMNMTQSKSGKSKYGSGTHIQNISAIQPKFYETKMLLYW